MLEERQGDTKSSSSSSSGPSWNANYGWRVRDGCHRQCSTRSPLQASAVSVCGGVGGSSFKSGASPWRVHSCVEVAGESEYTGQWAVVVLVEQQNGGMWGEQGGWTEALDAAVSWE